MVDKKNKTDPLLNMTDEELYSMRSHPDCPVNELWNSHRDLLESTQLTLCCRAQARLLQKPKTDVARVLNEAGIACVLWSYALHGLYGLRMTMPHCEFVVADQVIDEAAETLCKSLPPAFGRVTPCPCAERCEYTAWDYAPWSLRYMLPHRGPYLHLHTELPLNDFETVVIRLYRQSTTLWALPPLTQMAVPDKGSQANIGKLALSLGPNYTLATHPRFPKYHSLRQSLNGEGPGPYPADLHPVVVPTPECTLEALMRIYARYSYSSDFGRLHQWLFHIEYPMVLFFDEIKMYNSDLVDVKRMTPIIGLLVRIVLKGDITKHELRVALREALSEPPNDDKSFRKSFHVLDDTLFSSLAGWCLSHDDPKYLEKIGNYPDLGRAPEKIEKKKKKRKYWLQLQK